MPLNRGLNNARQKILSNENVQLSRDQITDWKATQKTNGKPHDQQTCA